MAYGNSKQILLHDLEKLSKTEGISFQIRGDKRFSPEELAHEIREETEIGKQHICMHMRAMEMINYVEPIPVTITKRWWQFWK